MWLVNRILTIKTLKQNFGNSNLDIEEEENNPKNLDNSQQLFSSFALNTLSLNDQS